MGAGGESGAGHALAQTTLLEEILFETVELLIEEVIGLVNKTDENVGHDLRRAGFDELMKVRVGKVVFLAEPAHMDTPFLELTATSSRPPASLEATVASQTSGSRENPVCAFSGVKSLRGLAMPTGLR
jgi:hypothetical protein